MCVCTPIYSGKVWNLHVGIPTVYETDTAATVAKAGICKLLLGGRYSGRAWTLAGGKNA